MRSGRRHKAFAVPGRSIVGTIADVGRVFRCPRLFFDGYKCFIWKFNRKGPLKGAKCFLKLEDHVKNLPEGNCLRSIFLGGGGKLNPPEIWAAYLQYKSGAVFVYTPALAFREDGLKSRATAQKRHRSWSTIYAQRPWMVVSALTCSAAR